MRWLGASLLFFLIISFPLYGKGGEEPRCDRGNFALPSSQQPGPLISFGENIIGRHQLQLLLMGDAYIGKQKHFIDMIPGILYGITDNFSVFFNAPVAVSDRNKGAKSSGWEDIFLQFEYAIYSRDSSGSNCSTDQVTIVANASFPTGSSHKNPPTGFGAMGYFIGTTYNRTWTDWVCFTSYGVELPTSHQGTKSGHQFLYQFGFGRNITNTREWLFAWIIEIDGTFSARDKIKGTPDPNSGGNVIYLTPSLSASSKHWALQLGVGYPIQQNLFGHQTRNEYLAAFNVIRTF